jgi:hypothetical protein
MEVPVLADELKRKVMDSVIRVVSDFQLGKVTEAQAKYAMDMLWLGVAGLVDDDFRLIMERFDETLSYHHDKRGKDQSYGPIEYFNNGKGKVALAVAAPDKSEMHVYVFSETPKIHHYDFSDEAVPSQKRLQMMDKLRTVFNS